MAFVQISLLEGQLWEFELTVNENVISVGMMLEWLGGIRSVGFLGEVSLRKIVVTPNAEELTLTTEMVVEKSRWYQVKLCGNHKNESVDLLFSHCITYSPIGAKFRVLKVTTNYGLWVHTDGCHQLFYLDYLVTLKLNDERRIAAVEKFREMMEKNSEIKLDRMRQLAEQFQLLHGHWSIYFDYNQNSLAHKVNSTWRQLIDAFFVGGLHNRAIGLSLKVTYDGYAIGVKTADFTAQSRVFAVEKLIRQAGVDGTLKYKPDVYSICDIYHGNKLQIRPTIYQSTADMRERISTITTDYTPGYQQEIDLTEPWQNHW